MVILASGIAPGRLSAYARRWWCRATWRPCSYRELHPRFVAEVCHPFFAGWAKKRNQTITEVNLTFCTEAKEKKNLQEASINRRRSSEREPRASAGEGGETVLNNAVNYSKSGSKTKR